ncbi:hypothetical protein BRC74_04975 [Halobacteriales archaeon QH_7_68_42]|jgi:hypothetical protein|nr:MAG: hypothetical protein BRC74_04975 [Halobacteriales archaeon QH_7_68_42]PSP73422.1 MAG: hypothetical protein BRC70_03185 [Halobacteriales archaeon QH_6_68_27]
MRPNDAYETFDEAYSYPIDRETIIETMGETQIESPNGPGETIAETLERSGREEFRSAQELTNAFLGTLSDEYIGRKYYDDRGDNQGMATNWSA